MLTRKRLKQVLRYEPRTGHFYWRITTGSRSKAGNKAGSISKSTGYVCIGIDGVIYLGHRLAFLYMLGRWPKPEGDHKNRKRPDNRWCNLREATRSQNLRNASLRKDSQTGHRNVSWDETRQRFQVVLLLEGKNRKIGTFRNLHDAIVCRNAARQF